MSTFLEELAKWATGASQTIKPRRKETLAAFLAVREEVKEAIAAGYALKTIWEHMHETGRVSFRYETEPPRLPWRPFGLIQASVTA
jgi:hypothetical protein